MHRPNRSSKAAVSCETIFLMMEPPATAFPPVRNRSQLSALSSVDPVHVPSGHVRTLKSRMNMANPKRRCIIDHVLLLLLTHQNWTEIEHIMRTPAALQGYLGIEHIDILASSLVSTHLEVVQHQHRRADQSPSLSCSSSPIPLHLLPLQHPQY